MTTEYLESLVISYAKNKSKLNDYTTLCDKENKEIKSLMKQFKITEIPSGDYVAKISVSTKETANESRMLAVIHDLAVNNVELYKELGIIKTREYIDFDALEAAIYNNRISEDGLMAIGKCYDTKEIETLRITKKKKKKEEN